VESIFEVFIKIDGYLKQIFNNCLLNYEYIDGSQSEYNKAITGW
jgi:hypothetical protein